MSSTLRALAVASCTALLVTGVASTAHATVPAAAFSVSPTYGPVGHKVTLTGADFSAASGVTFGGVASTSITISPTKVTAVVPPGAKTGVVVVADSPAPLTGPIFTVQQPTHAIATVSASSATYHHKVVVTATATAAGRPAVGESAVVQHETTGKKTWHKVSGTSAKKTGSKGTVQWTVSPGTSGRYRVTFATSHAFIGTTTAPAPVRVLPYFHLAPLHTVSQFSATQLRGSIHPHLTGKVYLQRYVDHHWSTVGHSHLVAGHFAFTITPAVLGGRSYRVVRTGSSLYAASTSAGLHVQVVHRTLTLGASGPDVLTLQRRLAKLHYDIGPHNGVYGTDTLHAVTAFQKVNNLAKDGQTGPQVWAALNHPKRPHLKHPDASESLAVEVNIHKQILLLARYGKIWRILDTSTAGGYLYTNSEGGQSRAVTPRGHFTIQYKITGWHKSQLGELYYPSYFTNTGYAIHGEGNGNDGSEVPPYANSHGCVRITNNAVLRYYSKLVVGTSVWIYG